MSAILMTVDVEEWFQVENLRPVFPPNTWDRCESRVEGSTRLLLDLFDEYHVVATFFVLGWVAERHPGLVREIHERGHEVASHGYGHMLCGELSRTKLREDLYGSKALLEDICGEPVHGYRAPNFSINAELVDLLVESGYMYDSSYNSFAAHGRYGRLEGTWRCLRNGCMVAENGLIEISISNLTLGRSVIPWGGGGYFRLYPFPLFHLGVKSIIKNRDYYLFYCHPWEFDPDQPRVKGISLGRRFRHYNNLGKTSARLSGLLDAVGKRHRFATCKKYIGNQAAITI